MKTGIRYMLSLLLTALLCIFAIAAGAHVLYGDYSRNQINDKYLGSFVAAQMQADDQLKLLLQYAQQLSDSLHLYVEENTRGGYVVEEATLLSLLGNFESNAGINNSIAFFLRSDPAHIYTSVGRLAYPDYERRLYEKSINADMSMLFSRLLTTKKPVLFAPATQDEVLMLAVPLGSAWSAYPATLLIMIDEALLTEGFAEIRAAGNVGLYGVDALANLVFGQPGDLPRMSSQALCAVMSNGVIPQDIDGNDYIFTRQQSSTGLLTYISVTPERAFYGSWYTLSQQLMRVILVVTVVAAAMSLLLGYVVYQPVRRAYTRITGRKPSSRGADELETIVDTYERTVENMAELEERAEANSSVMLRQFTLGLINGIIRTRQEFDGYKESIELTLGGDWWVSLYACLPEETLHARMDVVLNALDGYTLPQGEMLYAECRWEEGIGIILNFDSDIPYETAHTLADSLLRHLNARDAAVRLSVGSVEGTPLRMGTSFYRATAAMKAAAVGEGGLLVYSEESGHRHSLSLDTALLAEGITYGNAEVALASLEDMIAKLRHSHERLPLIRLMCSDMLNTVVRYAQKQNLPLDKTRLCEVADFHSLETFSEGISQLIADICAASNQRRMQDSAQDRSRVITTITQSYKRNDFSLKLLSEQTNMSMSKINILLKENLGCSFVQYVSLLRMNEVKRLLRETDDSIQSIVQDVGYIDVSSFMRKFKQMEGVSPGQYRSLRRQNGMVEK